MSQKPSATLQVADELTFLAELVPLAEADVVELGCGAAALARSMVAAYPGCRVTALEVDSRQHAHNLQNPAPRLTFIEAGAQAVPLDDNRFDLAMMLKSLHHIPMPLLDNALAEAWRVLRPGGCLYVSEPVFAGDFNEIVRLFNDEQVVRAAAQAALDRALESGRWRSRRDIAFEMPALFKSFEEFEKKLIDVSFADRQLDADQRAAVRARFAPHLGPDGARFQRPMHVRLLEKV